jgi:hypothetical protein
LLLSLSRPEALAGTGLLLEGALAPRAYHVQTEINVAFTLWLRVVHISNTANATSVAELARLQLDGHRALIIWTYVLL